jgi:superoxide dismutase, Cu-Zn family
MRGRWLLALLGITMLVGGCTGWRNPPQATADLKNANGEAIGSAGFWEESGGVRLFLRAAKLSPGLHGLHLHAVGKCDPPDFSSAAAHLNPTGKQHGFANPTGPHAGDLPNLPVGDDGTGTLHYLTTLVTLGSGPTSLFDADGTAVVIHAGPDDHGTDPTGNSGGRVACGVLVKRN